MKLPQGQNRVSKVIFSFPDFRIILKISVKVIISCQVPKNGSFWQNFNI
jgi:hypothetical protein